MNFNKGAHDKDRAATAERVGFIELLNLATDDPNLAWREMMVTAEAADDLKKRAGLKVSGRKNDRPVYAFSLEWHPDDRPDEAHMRHYAHEALKLLGLQERQAVIVQHTDTPHAHVHITVNMIHPETGASARLYNDDKRLDRFCHDYEIRMGQIRSPARAKKYAALDGGRKPPPRKREPKRFQQPDLKPANENRTARDRAAAIKTGQEAYVRRLKETQDGSWKRRKAEADTLWKDYRTAKQALLDRHKFAADQIYKHRRDRNALPFSIQGFRDWRETREWTALMKRLKAENRRFEYRERTLMGFLTNAIALVRPGMNRTGRGFLPVLFNLLVSGKMRRELMQTRQALARRYLSEKQFGSRKARAAKIRLLRDAQMAALSRAYDIQKQALDRVHEEEIARQKKAWRDLSKERDRLWTVWREEFGINERARRQGSGSGDQGGDAGGTGDSRSPAPPKLKDQFRNPQKIARTPKATEQFLGAGTPIRKTPPKPDDSRLKTAFDPAAPSDMLQSKAGWKKRRSAAERRADGSYKPRQRKGPSL